MAHPKRRQSKTRTAKRRTHEHWQSAQIVVSGMFIIQYVQLVDITVVS